MSADASADAPPRINISDSYRGYRKSLDILQIDSLKDRREQLCLNFAKKCIQNPKTKEMFPENFKAHQMLTRKPDRFRVTHANTTRFKNPAIIYMQNLLNKNEKLRNQLKYQSLDIC